MARSEKIIVSFTSHKKRLPLIDDIFRSHVRMCEKLGLSLCFSCQDDSIQYMTEYQRSLVENGKVELLHVPKDSGSNTKWTLCREAHKDAVMIVVDDDWTYDVEGIRSLIETHQRFPDAVVCRAYRSIPWIGNELPLYEVRPYYSYPKTVTAHIKVNRKKDNVLGEERVLQPGTAYPEHFLGVLYPPGFPRCGKDEIPNECLKDDDVFIGGRVAAEGMELVFAGRNRMSLDRERDLPGALWASSRSVNGQGTFAALKSEKEAFFSRVVERGLGKVFLLTCNKYPKRRESIKKELERVGIGFTEVYDDGTYMPEIVYAHKHLNRCHLAKYRALGMFLENPTERVTIIEDDVRFLKCIKDVSEAICKMPVDFGACRLSWAPSPYIRKELENTSPNTVHEVEYAMSMPGSFWALCPWASTDGCTIINADVARRLHDEIGKMIEVGCDSVIDNSDDMLCRVCNETGMPMYVYKPLVCIQVSQNDVEAGKSVTRKFLTDDFYRVHGITRPISEFNVSKGFGRSMYGIGTTGSGSIESEDGFGYVRPMVRREFYGPVENPQISTRKVTLVLPRIR